VLEKITSKNSIVLTKLNMLIHLMLYPLDLPNQVVKPKVVKTECIHHVTKSLNMKDLLKLMESNGQKLLFLI